MFGYTDLSIYGMWLQFPRNVRIELSFPYFAACFTYLVPRLKFVSFTWSSIFMTLPITAWISFLLSFITIICIYYIYEKVVYKTGKNKSFIRIDQIFIDVIAITFNNNIASTKLTGTLVLLTTWSIFTFFYSLFYSTVLIAHLTIPEYTRRINTAEDFAANNLSWGLPAAFEQKYYFDLSKESHRFIQQRFKIEPFELTDEIKKQLNEGKYAVSMATYGGTLVVLRQRDDLHNYPIPKLRVMKDCLTYRYFALGFQNNSPFIQAFNRWLHLIVDTGVFDYIKRHEIRDYYPQYWDSVYVEYDRKNTKTVTLTIQHVHGAFYVLGVGLFLSFITFCAELYIKHYSSKIRLNFIKPNIFMISSFHL